jgi:hypothetical protein
MYSCGADEFAQWVTVTLDGRDITDSCMGFDTDQGWALIYVRNEYGNPVIDLDDPRGLGIKRNVFHGVVQVECKPDATPIQREIFRLIKLYREQGASVSPVYPAPDTPGRKPTCACELGKCEGRSKDTCWMWWAGLSGLRPERAWAPGNAEYRKRVEDMNRP